MTADIDLIHTLLMCTHSFVPEDGHTYMALFSMNNKKISYLPCVIATVRPNNKSYYQLSIKMA